MQFVTFHSHVPSGPRLDGCDHLRYAICYVGDDVAAGGAANRHGRDGEGGCREGESLVLSVLKIFFGVPPPDVDDVSRETCQTTSDVRCEGVDRTSK